MRPTLGTQSFAVPHRAHRDHRALGGALAVLFRSSHPLRNAGKPIENHVPKTKNSENINVARVEYIRSKNIAS